MSRYRTIKPEFWTSAQIVECSTNARLLFIGLWNFCDDFGRHAFLPKQIKAEIFPADDFSSENILGMLDELSSNGLIEVYSIENKDILQVTGWHHQKIDRPQKARFPAKFDEHSTNDRRSLAPEGNRVEYRGKKGEEKKQNPSRVLSKTTTTTKKFKIPISATEPPSDQQIADAEKRGLTEPAAIEAEWGRFRDYNLAKGSNLADWCAAWRRWLDKRSSFSGKANGGTKPRPPPPAPGQNRLRTASGLWVDQKFYPD
jgi:hypothetical protein